MMYAVVKFWSSSAIFSFVMDGIPFDVYIYWVF